MSEQFVNLHVGLAVDFVLCVCFGRAFCVSLDHFIPLLLAFVLLDLVYSVLSQEIGWEERL